jgi:hypothetical protein
LIAEDNILIETPIKPIHAEDLLKHVWIVILHAKRIPPHIGLLINGVYNSLTIKGHELNISAEALLKTISQRKLQTVLIKLIPHPVFSTDYQLQVFKEMVQQFPMVKQYQATCLSPVKLFLEEFYALKNQSDELLFELMQRLVENKYIYSASTLNLEALENGFELPLYNATQLQERIEHERLAFYKD